MYKIIGAIIGFLILGIFGALFGFIFGSFLDIYLHGLNAAKPSADFPRKRQAVFLETVFILMGRMAKVDGRINEVEIRHVEQFMKKLGISSKNRLRAIALFKRGASPDYKISPQLDLFLSECGGIYSLKQMLLVYLIILGLSDGQLNEIERKFLKNIAIRLGYSNYSFEHLLDMVTNQSHFSHGQTNSVNALDDAYKALGVKKDSTNQEIKRAYRKLMSQYHPDKLMGQGVPENMVKVATEQVKDVQTAYELIKKARGLT